jgi:predicted DNA binding CopG/RHH family protein
MSKRLPALKSDKDAEELLEKDLAEYINAENLAPFPFEYRPKRKSANLRISDELGGSFGNKAAFLQCMTFDDPTHRFLTWPPRWRGPRHPEDREL